MNAVCNPLRAVAAVVAFNVGLTSPAVGAIRQAPEKNVAAPEKNVAAPEKNVEAPVDTPTAEPSGSGEPPTDTPAGHEAAPAAGDTSPGAGDNSPAPADTSSEQPQTATRQMDPDTRAAAANAFLEGSKYYELGQYPRAIEQFETAWRLSHEPLLLFNLGQAHRKFFDVDPDIEHLRRAKVSFENYDKRMAGSPGYEAKEIARVIAAIDAQIAEAEAHGASRVEREIRAREEAERRRLWLERERRTVKGLNASGITLITLGSLSFAMGFAGLLTRTANKIVLDHSTGGPREVNLSSASEDRRRRNGFLTGGQLAFSGFIIGGILLPVGITLKVLGGVRERRALGKKQKRSDVALGLDGSLTVRF